MRFTRFHIDAFGRLRQWDSGPISGNLVVVYGPNEAGKSTLFRFLSSLLYGIYPADRDRHPYAPWDGAPLSGRGELQLRDGTVVRVYRRLLSQPQGRVEYLDAEGITTGEDLRNRTLPPAAHIPQRVFEEVFALTLDELRFPHEDAWSVIDQKLLGNLAAEFLRPVRQVIQDLQEEADKLWKPNRRGRHREKEIEAELSRLQGLRQEAAARDREMREAHRASQQLEALLEDLAREEHHLKVQLRRAERLLPVRRTLQQIEELEQEAGDLSPWSHLPDDPLQAASQLEEQGKRLERALHELKEQAQQEQEHVAAFTDQDRILIAHEDDLHAAAGTMAQLEHLRARLEGLRQERERLQHQVDDRAQRLLSVPWQPQLAGPLLQVSEADLRARIRSYRETHERYQEARARTAGVRARLAESPARPSYAGGILLGIVGLALAAFGGMAATDVFLWGGLILCLLSATQLWGRWRERHRLHQERQRWQQRERECLADEQQAAAERDQSLRQVERLLATIPVAPARLEEPDETLLVDLQEIQSPLRTLAQLEKESRQLQEQFRQQLDPLTRLLETIRPAGAPAAHGTSPSEGDEARAEAAPASSSLAESTPSSEVALASPTRGARTASAEEKPALSPPEEAVEELPEEPVEELVSSTGEEPAAPSAEEPVPPAMETVSQDSPGDPTALDHLMPVFWRLRQELQGLPSLLADAHHRRRRARAAREALVALERRIEETAAERDALRRRLDQLHASLATLGGSTLLQQAEELRRRRKALQDARALRDHLRRHYPDLDQLVEEIRAAQEEAEGWRADDAFIVWAQHRLQEIDAQRQEARQELGRLRERIRTLEKQTTLDDIDGEIAALEEERSHIRRERDRLMLLVHVLTEAEQRFREEHQPDVLRRAGEYLETITAGRYRRLLVEETPEGRQAWVKQAGHPDAINLRQPLSRGTFDQIYLALRLALVDHLDAGQEPLPLFLDEVLVHWDGVRRDQGLRLLAQLSSRRQVFFFTCHEGLARELTGSLQAWRLDMPVAQGHGHPRL